MLQRPCGRYFATVTRNTGSRYLFLWRNTKPTRIYNGVITPQAIYVANGNFPKILLLQTLRAASSQMGNQILYCPDRFGFLSQRSSLHRLRRNSGTPRTCFFTICLSWVFSFFYLSYHFISAERYVGSGILDCSIRVVLYLWFCESRKQTPIQTHLRPLGA